MIEALNDLTEGQYQPETKSEAGSLLRALLDFRFISYLVSKSIKILKGLTNTIETLRNALSEWLKTAKKLNALDPLDLIHSRDLVEAFPNVCVALRIYITLPTTSVVCEWSFSKLKLIRNYLRSYMTQERLTNGSDKASLMNYEHAINLFAERKARK
ncbi:hypothetical protein PR048_006577, partial [Dryococelus australis]